MALSVLVALMMLAVPLASSSNLFVDGGQTNSNGDAPLSASAEASYDITFKLNADNKSLDAPKLTALPTTPSDVNWYMDENKNVHAIVPKGTELGTVITALYTSNISKDGYDLDVWKNEATGAVYNDKSASDKTPVTSDMTFSAVWLLKDTHCEVSVIVEYKGETTEYVKAYEYVESSNQKKITVPKAGLIENGIPDIDTFGIVVNHKGANTIEPYIEKVYSFKATYGDNKEFEFGANANVTIPVDSKISIKYTFDSENYSEITVKSIAFKDGKDVTLYASKLRAYTYADVYKALTTKISSGATGYEASSIETPILKVTPDDKKFITAEGYELTGWNEGAELLQSENNASSPLTLDAKLNGYYVIFMVNGQFEYVYVPFGELSADKTTLDVSGVHHWMWMKYSDYKDGSFVAGESEGNTILPFNFASTNDKASVEGEANGKIPAAILIACFTPSTSTSYAVFDASSHHYAIEDSNAVSKSKIEGTFGNEYVQYLIIPGKVGDKISVPTLTPVYDEELKMLFISWNKYPASVEAKGEAPDITYSLIEMPYSEKDVYGEAVAVYSANSVKYNYTITFYNESEVVGIFYYDPKLNSTTDINSGLVAFAVNGKVYKYVDYPTLRANEEDLNAYNSVLYPDKAGYEIKQWNDANKNTMITIKSNGVNPPTYAIDKINIEDMKDNLNLYAQFNAQEYAIVYINTYTGAYGTPQYAHVDETVTLFGESTFVYSGYKLTGWSDRPDGNGTNYDLGASFTLNGEQYEDLENGEFILYAVWEKVGSGSGTGGNTGGDNDNTALYLIAGMLAVIAILAIVGILLMRRK